ncbi:hypothetical protein TorRG33x02_153980 [Trema orientale]|uniref:CLAVATA3/ESR (CLE)-related protein n=1 Tax=Trema orientale TaxID=63057 RepID=A0A2P5ET06_TREOI|nr:hypothetical protein TorRG33x02_153980 [Trema orientale]
MKRKQFLVYLLFAFLLVASRHHYPSNAFMIHAAKSVTLNGANTPARKSLALRQMLATLVNSRKLVKENTHKVPSGPNPIGNRHPPSIHD